MDPFLMIVWLKGQECFLAYSPFMLLQGNIEQPSTERPFELLWSSYWPLKINLLVALFSNSQAAIHAIGSTSLPSSDEILQCQEYLRKLALREKHVVLQWIPSHCGIDGNEQADFLAKKGSRLLQSSCSTVSYHSIKLYTKHIMSKNYKLQLLDRVQSKRWKDDDLLTIPTSWNRCTVPSSNGPRLPGRTSTSYWDFRPTKLQNGRTYE